MIFYRTDLSTCKNANNLVVVIDVIRAFTTSAFVLNAGAKEIILVSTVEEAYKLRNEIDNSVIIGEVNGIPPDGFDYGNSPTELINIDFTNKIIIQRTSMGTQGVVRSINAEKILVCSCVCAKATVKYINSLNIKSITFVETGLGPDGSGEEDVACSDYLEACLSNKEPDSKPFLERVINCRNSQSIFADPTHEKFKWIDIEYCIDIDRFDFPMIVKKERNQFIIYNNDK